MWLRSVEIAGFKTYKQSGKKEFHPGRNLIVGYNGAGKSNVLDAILFVLSDNVLTVQVGGNNGPSGNKKNAAGAAARSANKNNNLSVLHEGEFQNVNTSVSAGGAGGNKAVVAAAQQGGIDDRQYYVELVFEVPKNMESYTAIVEQYFVANKNNNSNPQNLILNQENNSTKNKQLKLKRFIISKNYTLNDKAIDKQTVSDLLEQCGIGALNSFPYWCIKQGKIAELGAMNSKQRLKYMEDFLGISKFDERRELAIQQLKEIEEKQLVYGKELVESLDKKINELMIDKEELEKFEQLTVKKKQLEAKIADYELKDATSKMGLFTSEKNVLELRLTKLTGRKQDLKTDVKKTKEELFKFEDQVEYLKADKIAAEQEYADYFAKKNKEMKNNVDGAGMNRGSMSSSDDFSQQLQRGPALGNDHVDQGEQGTDFTNLLNIAELTSQIKQEEEQLQHHLPATLEQKQKELDFLSKQKIPKLQMEKTKLFTEKTSLLSTPAQVCEKMKVKIPRLERELKETVGKELEKLEKKLNEEEFGEKKQQDLEEKRRQLGQDWEKAKQACWALDQDAEQFSEEKRQYQQHLTRFKQRKQQNEQFLTEKKQKLTGTFPRGIRTALLHLEQNSVEGLDKRGIKGTLLECLAVDPVYQVAIESVGGASLLNLLVDTDKAASLILKEVREKKLGSIECVPLDRLTGGNANGAPAQQAEPMNYLSASEHVVKRIEEEYQAEHFKNNMQTENDNDSDDDLDRGSTFSEERPDSSSNGPKTKPNNVNKPKILSLVNCIKCDEWVKPAVRQIYGRWLLCETLDLCEFYSKRYGLSCITLDGDKVLSSGFFSGGFVDPNSFVRLKLQKRVNELKAEEKELHKENRDVLEKKHDSLALKQQTLQEKRDRAWNYREKVRVEWCEVDTGLAKLTAEISESKRRVEELKLRKEVLVTDLKESEKLLKKCEQEMADGSTAQTVASSQQQAEQITLLEKQLEETTANLQKSELKARQLFEQVSELTKQQESKKKHVDTMREKLEKMKLRKQKDDNEKKEEEKIMTNLKKTTSDLEVAEDNFVRTKASLTDLEQESLQINSEWEEISGKVDFYNSKIVTEFTRAEDAKQRAGTTSSSFSKEKDIKKQGKKAAPGDVLLDENAELEDSDAEDAAAEDGDQNDVDVEMEDAGDQDVVAQDEEVDDNKEHEEDSSRRPTTSLNISQLLLELSQINRTLDESEYNQRALEETIDYKHVRARLQEEILQVEQSVRQIQKGLEIVEKNKRIMFENSIEQLKEEFADVFAELTRSSSTSGGAAAGGATTSSAGARLIVESKKTNPGQGPMNSTSSNFFNITGLKCEATFKRASVVANKMKKSDLLSENSTSDALITMHNKKNNDVDYKNDSTSYAYQDMRQLSGGQKTICALSLLLALLRLKPAPFYLLDEVDAALDPEYRASLASYLDVHLKQDLKVSMVNEAEQQGLKLNEHFDVNDLILMDVENDDSSEDFFHRGNNDRTGVDDVNRTAKMNSSGAQLLITSFRPELIKNSDKIFIIENHNRVSTITEGSKEQAMQIVNMNNSQ
ncbi:unnamed protein product [Amoebophrya sp. A120]|nr:unnamed protein product [Amoebophrya sp. A120]|eukprot:GSA120T00007204001.1